MWDGVIRGSGAAAALAIPLIFLRPSVGPLIGFVLVTIWVNGPIAPFLPATYEPILMMYGRLYMPVVVGLLGISAIIYVEFLNYQLYSRILHGGALTGVRDSRVVRRLTSLFERAHFLRGLDREPAHPPGGEEKHRSVNAKGHSVPSAAHGGNTNRNFRARFQ